MTSIAVPDHGGHAAEVVPSATSTAPAPVIGDESFDADTSVAGHTRVSSPYEEKTTYADEDKAAANANSASNTRAGNAGRRGEEEVAAAPQSGANEANTNSQLDVEYPTGLKFALINVAITLVVFLVALDQTIVSTAVPVITNQFNAFSDVGWYASAYLLTSTAFQPLFGRLYGSFSIKWTFLISFLIFELGSLICAVSNDSTTFIVGRAIAGLGLAGGYSGCLIIISVIAPLHVRPLLTSLIGAIYGAGAVLGPLIGGALTSRGPNAAGIDGWRWCFYLNLLFIPIVVPVVLLFVKTPKRKFETTAMQRLLRIDWQGTALILASVICILLVFQWGGVKYAWSDSKIIGLIIGFVAIGALFVVDQWWMGERATIPFRILKNKTVYGGSIANFLIAATYFIELYFLPIYFQSVRGSSAIRSAVQTLPFIVAVIFAVTFTGGLVNKFGYYIPYLLLGTALMTIGGGTLYLLEPDTKQATWVGLQFLAGFGPGMAFMLPFISVSAVLDVKDIELGSAITITCQTLGGTIATSLAQSIFQNKFSLYLRDIPGVNPAAILAHGVSAFRETTPADLLPAVVAALNKAVSKVWLIVVVFGCISFLSVFLMDLKGKIDVEASKAAEVAKKDGKASAAGDVEKAAA